MRAGSNVIEQLPCEKTLSVIVRALPKFGSRHPESFSSGRPERAYITPRNPEARCGRGITCLPTRVLQIGVLAVWE